MSRRRRKGFWQGLAVGIAVSAAAVTAGGVILNSRYKGEAVQGAAASVSADSVVDGELIEKLHTLEAYVNQNFLMEKDDQEAFRDGIYKGYMEALGDPYSCYYTEEEYEQLMESTSGTYSGIGVVVTQDA